MVTFIPVEIIEAALVLPILKNENGIRRKRVGSVNRRAFSHIT